MLDYDVVAVVSVCVCVCVCASYGGREGGAACFKMDVAWIFSGAQVST